MLTPLFSCLHMPSLLLTCSSLLHPRGVLDRLWLQAKPPPLLRLALLCRRSLLLLSCSGTLPVGVRCRLLLLQCLLLWERVPVELLLLLLCSGGHVIIKLLLLRRLQLLSWRISLRLLNLAGHVSTQLLWLFVLLLKLSRSRLHWLLVGCGRPGPGRKLLLQLLLLLLQLPLLLLLGGGQAPARGALRLVLPQLRHLLGLLAQAIWRRRQGDQPGGGQGGPQALEFGRAAPAQQRHVSGDALQLRLLVGQLQLRVGQARQVARLTGGREAGARSGDASQLAWQRQGGRGVAWGCHTDGMPPRKEPHWARLLAAGTASPAGLPRAPARRAAAPERQSTFG